jgi:hypothetical protein
MLSIQGANFVHPKYATVDIASHLPMKLATDPRNS